MNKTKDTLKYFGILRVSVAVSIALLITTLIIFMVSEDPQKSLYMLLVGPISSKRYLFNVFEMMVPLMFTGLSISLVFKSGNFSMITDASFYVGAVIASFIAIKMPLPELVHPTVAIIVAGFIGGLIGMIPAILRTKFKANELVTSLMLNYVFFYSGLYIVNNYLIDPAASAFASLKFEQTAKLAQLMTGTRLHTGFIIGLLVCGLLYVFLTRTKWGYEIRIVGSNPKFAKYSGMNSKKVILYTSFISGFVGAMGGAIEKLGMYNRFQWAAAPSYAWDGVIISILSSNNPIFVPVAAFFLSYLRIGADIMARQTGVQNEIVSLIQGLIILLVTAERFLYFLKQRKESELALQKNVQKIEEGA